MHILTESILDIDVEKDLISQVKNLKDRELKNKRDLN